MSDILIEKCYINCKNIFFYLYLQLIVFSLQAYYIKNLLDIRISTLSFENIFRGWPSTRDCCIKLARAVAHM